jgi:response regulator RpfG family c-di-GMP phosphodiesterase
MSDMDFLSCEEDESQTPADLSGWKVLVVDDDKFIHQVTKLVLSNLVIEGRHIDILAAYSGQEAREVIAQHDDIALAFVDVVMETDDAGLELVRWIRTELKNHITRLILRTGQAGSAPEEKVIREYDINDYKEKTELTASKLTTAVYAGIRSYRDIVTIKNSLDGFERLVQASTRILKTHSLMDFGTASLQQLFNLLEMECSSLYVAHITEDIYHDSERTVLGATGDYVGFGYSYESVDIPAEYKALIDEAFEEGCSKFTDEVFVGYYATTDNTTSVLLVKFDQPLDKFQLNLLEIYATNVALIFENVTFRDDIESTQAELIYILGDAIEARSKETGAHVKRVAFICFELAQLFGCDEKFSTILSRAAPLHDIGKIGIPESILHKPGKLEGEEWEIMKTHAALGGDLLKSSRKAIAKAGEKLARYHHENWDGTGYPEGLAGEDIPLEARIMAVADVFDALGSKRSYKSPWTEEKIIGYFKEERGKKFQPELVDLLLENFEAFTLIRQLNPD